MKKRQTTDLYKQFADHYKEKENRHEYWGPSRLNKKPLKKSEWTPEDQAIEDILWAS